MFEVLPGILWLASGDDNGHDALRSHGVSVLVTDRDDLSYGNVLRVDMTGLADAIVRLYTKRVCAAVCVSGLPNPRPLLGALVREVAGVQDVDTIEAIVAANFPGM